MWGIDWLTPAVVFDAFFAVFLLVVGLVTGWLWRRRRERSRSLRVEWDDQYSPTRDIGQEFVLPARVFNLTEQRRPFVVQRQGLGSSSDDVFDTYSIEQKGAITVEGQWAVPPKDQVELLVRLPVVRYGTNVVSFVVRGTKGRFQEYRGRKYMLRAEQAWRSTWSQMSQESREELASKIATLARERRKTSKLTVGRVVEFYDLVEKGSLTRMPGAIWQANPGFYSDSEKRFLLNSAAARGVSVRWASQSMPLSLWKRLYYQ